MNYTGSLLLGDGFIPGLYVHMGVQSSWKFEKVIELVFKNGVLEKEEDLSEKMAEIRRRNIETGNEHDGSLHLWPEDTIFF